MLSKLVSLHCLPLAQVILSTHTTDVSSTNSLLNYFKNTVIYCYLGIQIWIPYSGLQKPSLALQPAHSITSLLFQAPWHFGLRSVSWHKVTGVACYPTVPSLHLAGTGTAAASPCSCVCVCVCPHFLGAKPKASQVAPTSICKPMSPCLHGWQVYKIRYIYYYYRASLVAQL